MCARASGSAVLALLVAVAVPVAAQAPAPLRPPDVMYVPTPQEVVDAMLRLAGVTATDVVYDLGSGDGRIVIIAAQKYGARGVGIELDPKLVEVSREIWLATARRLAAAGRLTPRTFSIRGK